MCGQHFVSALETIVESESPARELVQEEIGQMS